MARLAQTADLTDIQKEILSTVRDFVDKEIIPSALALEHADEYPEDIVKGMAEMGLFGLTIPEEFGGLGESLLTYALVVEQIARGWMSISGVINTHFIVAYMIAQHGTDEQKQRLLPKMATGEVRGAFSMSEPECGSDVAALKTRAKPEGDEFVLNGQKMWLTNGARAGVVATLVKDDLGADSVYKNLTTFLIEKEPGFGETLPGLTIPGDVEAGMAKLLASEYCAEVTQESFRIHGGYGYSKEYEIERLMREAPFLLIGEGTSEIQKTIISRGLLREYRAAQ